MNGSKSPGYNPGKAGSPKILRKSLAGGYKLVFFMKHPGVMMMYF